MDQVEKELLEQITGKSVATFEMPKTLSRGIFWVLAETKEEITVENILPVHKFCDRDGNSTDSNGFSSKSGLSYNHKETWAQLPKKITKGKPFDYYPRGRVEIRNGKATIWMNGNVLSLANDIKEFYGLSALQEVVVREDGSDHYKCHFDR